MQTQSMPAARPIPVLGYPYADYYFGEGHSKVSIPEMTIQDPGRTFLNLPWLVGNRGSGVSLEFQRLFLDGVKEWHGEANLLVRHDLPKSRVDDSIMDGFGGEERVLTCPAYLCYLLERQKTGQPGFLLATAPNIFYMENSSRRSTHCVEARWMGTGWCVGAWPVGDNTLRLLGDRVILPYRPYLDA